MGIIDFEIYRSENEFFNTDNMILEPWQTKIINDLIQKEKLEVKREFVSNGDTTAFVGWCNHDGVVYILDMKIVPERLPKT
jgi:hypothetical protein